MNIFLIILGLVLFQLLVILHEYGHFLIAKRNGVDVEEFGLGFPPKIAGKTMGKGIFRGYYTINWLPLGGFVRLKGENDNAKGKRTYGGSSLKVKAKIILAGVAVNYIIAVILFTILAAVGIPKLLPLEPITTDQQFTVARDTKIIDQRTYINYVDNNSPAAIAGVEQGDKLLKIGETQINSYEDLKATTPLYAGQTVNVVLERGGTELVKPVSFISEDEHSQSVQEFDSCMTSGATDCATPKGYFGVLSQDFVLQRSTWSSPITGVVLSAQYTKVTFQGIWHAISALFSGNTQEAENSVAGPLGIFFVIKQSANYGLRFLLMFIATISLTLAIMNSLPIPALDGGRLMLTVLFRKVLKKPLTKSLEERI
ncbi:site-2 protease family protein, partial [Candidatus Saccharibacteria bacterium]|nr:site-2 protease family protein [Candidatus Saccharibacteria bacterium]